MEPGDAIEAGDRVVEVLVRGMTFDVAAPAAGVLARVEAGIESTVTAGDVLAWIEPSREGTESGERNAG